MLMYRMLYSNQISISFSLSIYKFILHFFLHNCHLARKQGGFLQELAVFP